MNGNGETGGMGTCERPYAVEQKQLPCHMRGDGRCAREDSPPGTPPCGACLGSVFLVIYALGGCSWCKSSLMHFYYDVWL